MPLGERGPPKEGEKDGQTMTHTPGISVTLFAIWRHATIEIGDIGIYILT